MVKSRFEAPLFPKEQLEAIGGVRVIFTSGVTSGKLPMLQEISPIHGEVLLERGARSERLEG